MLPAHEEVALIETEIDALAERIESCRKLSLVTKAAIAVGIAALVLFAAGMASPLWLILGITAVLGGSALLGSTRTTLESLRERLRAQESKRAAIISGLELRVLSPSEHGEIA
jgi:hypothetical protein